MKTAALVLLILAQDAKRNEAKELLAKALEASQKAGGLTVAGAVEREDPLKGMGAPLGGFLGDGIEGAFTAVVGANGVTTVKVENEQGLFELFQRGDKVVQRQTWTGKQAPVGAFAHEATSLLSLARIAKHLDKATDVAAGERKKIGDIECVSVKLRLPAVLAEEPADGPLAMKLQELKRIDAVIWIGAEDGLVRRLEFKLTKGFSSAIRIGAPGAQDEEEGEEGEDEGAPGFGNLAKLKFVSTWTLTVKGYDAAAAVEVPSELKRFLND